MSVGSPRMHKGSSQIGFGALNKRRRGCGVWERRDGAVVQKRPTFRCQELVAELLDQNLTQTCRSLKHLQDPKVDMFEDFASVHSVEC